MRSSRGVSLAVFSAILFGCAVMAEADVMTVNAPVRALCRSWDTAPCVAQVGASLRSERSGQPVPGKRLWFFSRGTVICSSVTDRAGTASCSGVAPSGRDLSERGYSVVFEGDGRYQATTVVAR